MARWRRARRGTATSSGAGLGIRRAEHVRDQRVHPFCRTLGTEPYLVVNCGDGDLREARDWVEYCNGTTDTSLVRLRSAHGHPEPHRVRYWGIGNEVDGAWQIGAKTAAEYARTYHEFAKVMRWTDPSIKLIASATSDWDGDIVERAQLLVEEAADLIDYVSIHWYVGDKAGDSAAYLATSELIEERLHAYEGLMRGLTLRRAAASPPDPARGRRVERLVSGHRRADRALGPSARGGLRPAGRAGRGDASQRLRPTRRDRAHGEPRPAGQRHRADRDPSRRDRAPDDLPSVRAVQAHDRLRGTRRVVGRRHVQRRSLHGRPDARCLGVARSGRPPRSASMSSTGTRRTPSTSPSSSPAVRSRARSRSTRSPARISRSPTPSRSPTRVTTAQSRLEIDPANTFTTTLPPRSVTGLVFTL